MARPARFNKRAFVSFLILFYGLVMTITGIVLYFAPPGRIAHWVEWRFWGLTKEEWQAVHTVFSFIFVIIAGFHLFYNWTLFWSYLKSRVQKGIKMKRELSWATLLTIVVFVLVLADVPPFSTIMNFGEYLSNSWATEQSEPPIPHAELFTLKEYCEEVHVDLTQAIRRLHQQGIKGVDSTRTIGEIAEANGLTPAELGQMISGKQKATSSNSGSYGYGRMTLEQICKKVGVEESVARQRLQKAGIEMGEEESLRAIAQRANLRPIDIVKIIKGEPINGEH